METETTRFILTDDGIVVGRAVNPHVPRTAQNVSDALDQLEHLIGGEPRPGLWDPRAVDRFPPEAWRAMITRLDGSLVALAILIDERGADAFGAFPDAIDALMMPVRVFRDETEAMTWLRQFADPGGAAIG